ncbi:MAG: exodeoxyribonuclease VIII [Ahrensia sp.]|nr:exodeoxyribonuclease VIII [Ahrensia sp.]
MSENMRYWDVYADIDPKFTKPITGKPYKGTSPNPQYVIKCLTELFGPVGEGFGWRVLVEGFQPLGDKTLHFCRIEFWHTDRAFTFEGYGQTMAVYKTNSGSLMVDEDAPKKSLTDAIIKAASHIGIAANIFLGRWGDEKYVQEVAAEYRAVERSKSGPSDDEIAHEKSVTDALVHIEAAGSDADLRALWGATAQSVRGDARVKEAFAKRGSDLKPKPADVDDNEIPY